MELTDTNYLWRRDARVRLSTDRHLKILTSPACERIIKTALVMEKAGRGDQALNLLKIQTLFRQVSLLACMGRNVQARCDLIALCLSRARIHGASSCRNPLGASEDIAHARTMYRRAISLCGDYHKLNQLLENEFKAFRICEGQLKEQAFLRWLALISPSLRTLERVVIHHLLRSRNATRLAMGAAVATALTLLALSFFA